MRSTDSLGFRKSEREQSGEASRRPWKWAPPLEAAGGSVFGDVWADARRCMCMGSDDWWVVVGQAVDCFMRASSFVFPHVICCYRFSGLGSRHGSDGLMVLHILCRGRSCMLLLKCFIGVRHICGRIIYNRGNLELLHQSGMPTTLFYLLSYVQRDLGQTTLYV